MVDKTIIDLLFAKYKFDIVVNLAVRAGVRYSFENTDVYITNNMMGFTMIMEVFSASTSSATGSESV